jgi:hypothetical protein
MRLASVVFALSLPTIMLGQQGFQLPAGCELPFKTIATTPDPAVHCGNGGCAPNDDKKFENLAKNNLCKNSETPTDLKDFSVFKTLQAVPDVYQKATGNREQLRSLKPLGEGSMVRVAAFIKEAHISDCDKQNPKTGEDVNCNVRGFALNDIHILLVQSPQDDPCASVTAEMSPHFRPDAWSQIDAKTPTKNLVRFTAPLFFDNSHHPCAKNHAGKLTGSPPRVSVWELHPVHIIEVCATAKGTDCAVDKDTGWVAYDQWIKRPGVKTTDTGRTARDRCGTGEGTSAPCATQ